MREDTTPATTPAFKRGHGIIRGLFFVGFRMNLCGLCDKRQASRTICRLRKEPARGNRSGKRDNLSASFFVKKDALQVKSTKCLYTGRHAHRRISVQQGSGASAYSRTTLFAQAMPLVCVACYTGTMEHRRWGAPICAYQNNNTRDSHAHIGAHLIYRLPSCHIWTASSSHTTSKQMRRLPTRPLKKSNTHIICR